MDTDEIVVGASLLLYNSDNTEHFREVLDLCLLWEIEYLNCIISRIGVYRNSEVNYKSIGDLEWELEWVQFSLIFD